MKKVGDLYWSQLSMWDFSKQEHIDKFSPDGFHFELFVVTDVISDTHTKVRNVKVGELSDDEIKYLTPEKNHNWSRVMGNNVSILEEI